MPYLPEYDPINHDSTFELGWLLQNVKVTDDDLCAILLNEYLKPVERLASALLKSPASVIAVIDRVFYLSILNRYSYTNETSGRAWLSALVITECLKSDLHPASRRLDPVRRLIAAFQPDNYLAPICPDLSHALASEAAASDDHLLLYFQHSLGLGPAETAYLLKLPPSQVVKALAGIHERLRDHFETCPHCRLPDPSFLAFAARLRAAFQPEKSLFALGEGDLHAWSASILAQVASHKARHLTQSRLNQAVRPGLLVSLVLAAGWLTAFFWSKHALPPLPPHPTPVLVAIGASTPQPSPLPSFQPSSPRTSSTPDFSPATDSDSLPALGSVLNLVQNSQNLWHSLWADVQVINYSPEEDPSLPQQTNRKQVWINQPSDSRVISGPMLGNPVVSITISNGNLTSQDFSSGQTTQNRDPTTDLLQETDLKQLFFPADIFPVEMVSSMGNFTVAGRDQIANRPTWILDLDIQGDQTYRFWVDAQYGVILRSHVFGGKVAATQSKDILVTAIIFNDPFQPAIFDPSLYPGDHFAIDFSGVPALPDPQVALSAWTPPKIPSPQSGPPLFSGLNLSISKLSFLNLASAGPDAGASRVVDLYAAGYNLGKLPVAGSAILSCVRSPDGSQIAFDSQSVDATGNTGLYLTSLAAIQAGRPALPDGITTGDFAFSPDSRRLAFFGCDKPSGFCGLFILDTVTGQLTRLVPLVYADYISWSPDGRSLALVSKIDAEPNLIKRKDNNLLMSELIALSQEWHFTVISAGNGEITYQRPFEWPQFNVPPDSPTLAWGSPFKAHRAGPQDCTNPPVG